MPKLIDIRGQRFGRLVVIARAGMACKRATWFVVCDCGRKKVVDSQALRHGTTVSCGCWKDECAAQTGRANKIKARKHGHRDPNNTSPTYRSWSSMNRRCMSKNHDGFRYYGAKGITICKRWRKFENFLADMGERPEGKTLGRKGDTGNYEPGNVEWQTKEEQVSTRWRERRT